ncbi:hypothetical protein BH20ACT24_BH20ACT24_19470 [soil metagenome]
MITGAHLILYSKDPESDRDFIRDVLEYTHVDAGDGWLIFKAPPTEVAVHPTEGPERTELYLLCDDVEATVAELRARGAEFAGPVRDEGWGLLTTIRLPGGGELGLYQPGHPTAHDL